MMKNRRLGNRRSVEPGRMGRDLRAAQLGSWGMRATISSRVIAIVARSVADCARPGLKVFNPVGGGEKYRRLGTRRSVSRRGC